ncbi:DUF5776 domain-containing protein [Lentilactobacillus diolivorans]|uniref:DUF5776 domain-containing protein n=2 Tax=Lentilactobacillus diolivorans TaxID=179838 RepID=A0A0R1SSI9_9LACO|nr:DUF5776 domain-containing protein [Lentilactobacillus diolivorans]KRL69205.1 hypothetical protein FC85_GL001562 [Lentilactobacillus diolivorans DSM 14421]GEP23947.1 hypothetical protein LDI01_15400 [Lentilactobacillus diolivorans]
MLSIKRQTIMAAVLFVIGGGLLSQTQAVNAASNHSSENTTYGSTTTKVSPFKIVVKKEVHSFKTADFTKSNLTGINHPSKQLVVTGTQKSSTGALQYQLDDGTFITSDPDYVTRQFYASLPKSKRIIVTDTIGINSYQSPTLKNKMKHFQFHQSLKVSKIKKFNNGNITYRLASGGYVTASKLFVKAM